MPKHGDMQAPAKGRRARRGFWTAVMWIAIAVFVAAVGYLGVIAFTYWNDAHHYEEIADKTFDPADNKLASMRVDWDGLRKINPEVVAWIYVPGTVISYPVCFSGDNQKYLDQNFDASQGVFTGSGAIFLDGEANPDFSCVCNFLFGHHMNDGSMFACLSGFAEKETFEASRDVYLLTPTCNYRYRTFSLVRATGSENLVMHKFADAKEYTDYVKAAEERSMVEPSEGFPDPATAGGLLCLTTCDYNEADGRAILYSCLAETANPALTGKVEFGK